MAHLSFFFLCRFVSDSEHPPPALQVGGGIDQCPLLVTDAKSQTSCKESAF